MNSKEFSQRFSKGQALAGLVLVALMLVFESFLYQMNPKLAVALLIGLGIGYTLTRSRFGFAGGIKLIYVTGDPSLSVALLVGFLATTIIYGAYHWIDALNGAVPAHLAQEGQAIITGTQNVHFFNIATLVGAFIFGIGMIIAGGCASGTLSDLGEGEARSLIAVIFFIFGSIPGHWLRGIIDRGPLGKVGVQHYLPQTFGYVGALLITALICLGLYYWAKAYQKKRIAEGTYRPIAYEDFEAPLTDGDRTGGFMGLYHNLFCTRWSFKTGALVLTAVSAAYFVFFKKAWGVTSAFTRMAVWFLGLFGIKFNDPSFDSIYEKIEGGILKDSGVILDIGIVFGAMICFLLASRFTFNTKFNMKNAGLFALGGLFMGFGARLAKGCNIGALYSSVTNFSVAGWLFTISISLGAVVALKFFSKGRSCLVPPRHRNPADF